MWGCLLTPFRRQQWVQNVTATLVVAMGTYDRITLVLACLHWLPVASRIRFKVLVLTYKTLHGLGPEYLTEQISQRSTDAQPTRMLQALSHRVASPREVQKSITRNRTFSVNKLPSEIRLAQSLLAFKKALKTLLFRETFGEH